MARPVRRQPGSRVPSWALSVGVWSLVLIVLVTVPFAASGVDLIRCADGYTSLNSHRVTLGAVIAGFSMLAVWRGVWHFFADPDRRVSAAGITIALVIAAVASLVVGFMVLEGQVPSEVTIGGGC